jgi:hypothetical protein
MWPVCEMNMNALIIHLVKVVIIGFGETGGKKLVN